MEYIKKLLGFSTYKDSLFISADNMFYIDEKFQNYVQEIINLFQINILNTDINKIKLKFSELDKYNKIIITFSDYCEYNNKYSDYDNLIFNVLRATDRSLLLPNIAQNIDRKNLHLVGIVKYEDCIRLCIIKTKEMNISNSDNNRIKIEYYVIKFFFEG